MADTGVPTSISKTYADPSQGYQFLNHVIPQAEAGAQAQKRTTIAEQDSRTTQFNANTARLGEMRLQKTQDMILKRQELEHALDAALFDTKLAEADAQLQTARLAKEFASQRLTKERVNDTEGSSLMLWMDQLPLESLVRDAHDTEFGERFNRLQGLDAKQQALAAYHAHKGKALELSVPVMQARLGPDIWAKLEPDYLKATGTGRALLAQVGDLRKQEETAFHEAQLFKGQYETVAPGLHDAYDLSPFYLGEDEKGIPRYDAAELRADVAQKKAVLDRQAQIVGGMKRDIDENVAAQSKDNQARVRILLTQQTNVNTNLAKLAAARGSGAPDAMKEAMASVLEKTFAEKGLVDPKKVAEAQSPIKDVREKAQAEIFEVVGKEWQKEAARLQNDLAATMLTDPATELYAKKMAVKREAQNLRTIQQLVARGAVKPEVLEAARKEAQGAFDNFNAAAGNDSAHTLYDGTYLVDPDRLMFPTAPAR